MRSSSTPVTVTVCGVPQVTLVNVSVAGLTVASPVSLLPTVSTTSVAGWAARATVNVCDVPASLTFRGPPTMVMPGGAATFVLTAATSLAPLRSVEVPSIHARFTTVPRVGASTVTVTSMLRVAPGVSEPMLHRSTSPPTRVPPVVDLNVIPAGIVSTTTTFCPPAGPALDASMVYLMSVPATALGGPLFFTPRSARINAPTFVTTSETSFDGSVSGVDEDTLAAFRTAPVVPAARSTTIVASAEAPADSDPTSHCTTPLSTLPTEVDTRVVPGGSESVATTPSATSGPAFDTWSVYVSRSPSRAEVGPDLVMATSAVADTRNVTVTGCGLFTATGDATRTSASYVPGESPAGSASMCSWAGAVDPDRLAESHAPPTAAYQTVADRSVRSPPPAFVTCTSAVLPPPAASRSTVAGSRAMMARPSVSVSVTGIDSGLLLAPCADTTTVAA